MTTERTRIPEALYMVIRNMGTPHQRTQLYHSLYYARLRADAIDGELFAVPTYTMEKL